MGPHMNVRINMESGAALESLSMILFHPTPVSIRMLHKCHTNAPLITNCFSLTLAIDIRGTPIFWGNESPSVGHPHMNPKQRFTFGVAKIQQKAAITFWQCSNTRHKHTTNKGNQS